MRAAEHGGEELGPAIRALLARPLLQRRTEPELFRSVAVSRARLSRWFEEHLGWRLHVDLPGGFARLHKRAAVLDPLRGLRRPRGERRPFDVLRYQLLALVCAQLLRRPLGTMGDLADALERLMGADPVFARFDPTRHVHRVAFVDVLVWLREQGAVECTAGELEGFSATEAADAVLRANTTMIPQLLSSDIPASRVRDELARAHGGGMVPEAGADAERWIARLAEEPRYGPVVVDPDAVDRGLRLEWARHQILRRLLDDPVVELDRLPEAVREYLQSPAGRDKVLEVVREAGLACERHQQVWLVIDGSLESSDSAPLFGSRPSVLQQVAGLLLSTLVPCAADGRRELLPRSIGALEAALEEHMRRHPKWAQGARKVGVPATCRSALELLESFGLVEFDGDSARPRAAAARFSFEFGTASVRPVREG